MAAPATAVSKRSPKQVAWPQPENRPSGFKVRPLAKAVATSGGLSAQLASAINAKAAKLAEVSVPAAGTESSVQDDRHRLDVWLAQREAPGLTSLITTQGYREVKLPNGNTLKVEVRTDRSLYDGGLSASRLSPATTVYKQNGKIVGMFKHARPITWENGSLVSSGAVCWVGYTQAENPEAWAKARDTAKRRAIRSSRRRADENRVVDTIRLNQAQLNKVVPTAPTHATLVRLAPLLASKEGAMPSIYQINSIVPTGEEAKKYGADCASHAKKVQLWRRAQQVLEGAPPQRRDEGNSFILKPPVSAGEMRAREMEYLTPSVQVEEKPLPPMVGPEPAPEQEVQTPVPEGELPRPLRAGYFTLVPQLERRLERDTEIPHVEEEDMETHQPPRQEDRLDKPEKLDRRKARKLKKNASGKPKLSRQEKKRLRRENDPDHLDPQDLDDQEDTDDYSPPEPTSVLRVFTDVPPAVNAPETKPPAGKPAMLQRWVQVKLLTPPGLDTSDVEEASMALVSLDRYQAALDILNGEGPLPDEGTPQLQGSKVVADEALIPTTVPDPEDPAFDEKMQQVINEEQQWLADLLEFRAEATLRIEKLRTQLYDHRLDSNDPAKRDSAMAWFRSRGVEPNSFDQVVVAGLLPPPKKPEMMTWEDLCADRTHALRQGEDMRVIKEPAYKKLARIRNLGEYYIPAHHADVRITRRWFGDTKVDGIAGTKRTVALPVRHSEGRGVEYRKVETFSPCKVERHRALRLAKYGVKSYRLAMKRPDWKFYYQDMSPFVRWAIKVGDLDKTQPRAKVKPKQWVHFEGKQHWVYEGVDLAKNGYRLVVQPTTALSADPPRRTLLDDVILGVMGYTAAAKPKSKRDMTPKEFGIYRRYVLLAEREDRTEEYTQYLPSPIMTACLKQHEITRQQVLAGDDERFKSWQDKWCPLSARKHVYDPLSVRREPTKVVLITTERTGQSLEQMLIAEAERLAEIGIEVTASDLAKLGIKVADENAGKAVSKPEDREVRNQYVRRSARWRA